jgi:O-succinylbenzoate synthase
VSRIREIELYLVALPLVRPFRVSFGTSTGKECVLARVRTDDGEGWGECVADDGYPGFSGEWNEGVWILLRDVLGPALLQAGDVGIDTVEEQLGFVRGNPMAKATLVDAVVDAELRASDTSLAAFLGADKPAVACGVSIGIADSTEELRDRVDDHLEQGYRRIKLKIMPGTDVERVAAPLHHEDLVQHAALQAEISTSICLDESIRSAADARAAIELGACRIVNIKQGRVGGVLEARRVHDAAAAADVPVWCGGMLETGIGRATNLALAGMPNFRLPGDTSASARYFHDDLTEPFMLEPDGTMLIPTGPGIGVEPRPDRLEACTKRRELLRG